ncbi:hypothetical protein [Methylorubrum extorquens]|uniref:hypothetical protein n=1 Tax=Methylorubrum extorquens TaxID=408 RepID=UPI001EE61B25|nr:hypothetical protein [Methylorubrum extorquens]MCG5247953.1 hypothetical protein [Methylorubrum extorquens]
MVSRDDDQETFYVVQSFSGLGPSCRMDTPLQASSESRAIETAERLALRKRSVIVLSVTGNVKTGEFEDPEVLASYGKPIGDADDGSESIPF